MEVVYCAPATKLRALSEAGVCLSVCLSVCFMQVAQKQCILHLQVLYNTKRNPTLEVIRAIQRCHLATRSFLNVLEAKKLTSSVLRKPSQIEPWFLLNTYS